MLKRLIAWLKKLFGFGSAAPSPTTPVPGLPDADGNFFSGYIESDMSDTTEEVREFKAAGKRTILPPTVDLRGKLGPVEQQGNTNACVAHAVTAALEGVTGSKDYSRLYVYWNARALANATSKDNGCTPRNAMMGISKFGVPEETVWPYDTTKILTAPPASAFTAGAPTIKKIKTYQSVTSLAALKTALAQGLPVAFAMQIPDTFVSVTRYTGEQPMWTSTTKWLGGHAMTAVGYDDAKGAVLVRNSFGPLWGNEGHCWIPYDWFSTMVSGAKISDAWTFIPA